MSAGSTPQGWPMDISFNSFVVQVVVVVVVVVVLLHVDCFTVSIIHRTLKWTSGSLTCVCDLIAYVYRRGFRFIVGGGGGREVGGGGEAVDFISNFRLDFVSDDRRDWLHNTTNTTQRQAPWLACCMPRPLGSSAREVRLTSSEEQDQRARVAVRPAVTFVIVLYLQSR